MNDNGLDLIVNDPDRRIGKRLSTAPIQRKTHRIPMDYGWIKSYKQFDKARFSTQALGRAKEGSEARMEDIPGNRHGTDERFDLKSI